MVRIITPLVAVLFFVLLPCAPAGAHAEVLGSSPGSGETVGGDLDRIDIVFAEPVSDATVEVTGPDGLVAGQMFQAEGLVIAYSIDAQLSDGEHTVTFAFSSPDGDFVILDFEFTYDSAAPPSTAVVARVENKGLSVASVAAIALLSMCTVGLAGLLAWRYRRLKGSQT